MFLLGITIGLGYLNYLAFNSSIVMLIKVPLIILISILMIGSLIFTIINYPLILFLPIRLGVWYLTYLVFTSSIIILFKIPLLIILIPLSIFLFYFP